ncbi:phage portal protein [Neobacillus thermocopriae]|uniref:phage portal protein n=1 Tax=Neobacillus thermocopriae TaxID=1215031 RepID=UPI002E21A8AF|nr:phage portal protein [Neobacillus thermocopriae]MED3623251.1 phage portal protein [Neobacillus thermocopriae]MED3714386.1 phage portal protein [Neobacillus thermocopriae]
MDPFIFPAEDEITGEVIQDFIEQHQALLPRYQKLKDLYEGNHAILSQEDKPEYKPDNRLVVNFAKYITDTFNGYFIGIPVKVSHDDQNVNDVVDEFMTRNDMDDNQAELSKMASIYGHAYELLYQNEDSETCCTYNSPLDMFIVYDDTIAQKPLFAVRYRTTEDGIAGQVFTKDSEFRISGDKEGLTLTDQQPHYYGDVPVIEYIENEERQSVFEQVETLINAYDKALSEKANDVDYFADAYMKLLGVELDEQGLKYIRDNRILNLYGSEADKIIAEFMEKPNGDTTQENLLDRIERLIYQISMVANINDESFGNASGVALEFKLQPMKNLAAMKERKFVSGMNRRFKMVFNILGTQRKVQPDEWRNLNYSFTRNIPRNISDEADTAGKLSGIVSKETQLSVLSFVDNPKQELERIQKEEQVRMGTFPTIEDGDFITGGEGVVEVS